VNRRPVNPRPALSPADQTPQHLVDDLLGAIRGQFYGDLPPKQWFQDRTFILRRVVLWPAAWLTKRGVTLKPERYKQILLDILTGIKRHGDTARLVYPPGYLAHCVQQHFRHHGEDIYDEAKTLRATLERVQMSYDRQAPAVAAPDPIQVLVEAGSLLRARRPKRSCKTPAQPLLPL
jgi:hypothetical protein